MSETDPSHCKNNALKRICLFGGTFDPIHLGHTHIASAAVEHLQLDKVIFLPCRQSPHKQGRKHAAEKHRLRMCQLATEGLDWATVNDFDLTAPSPCYSWRTAEAMQKQYPEAQLYWLMGTDQWEALPKWNRPDYLAELVEFIVFTRGAPAQERQGFRMHAIEGSHPASATQIRETINTTQHQDWLSRSVSQYIERHHLYR